MVDVRCIGLFSVVDLRGHRSAPGLLLRRSGIHGVYRTMVEVVATLDGLSVEGIRVKVEVVHGSSETVSSSCGRGAGAAA